MVFVVAINILVFLSTLLVTPIFLSYLKSEIRKEYQGRSETILNKTLQGAKIVFFVTVISAIALWVIYFIVVNGFTYWPDDRSPSEHYNGPF